MATAIQALGALQVSKHLIPAYGFIPNTSLHNRPLLIYRSVFPSSVSAASIESHLRSVGVVAPQWRFTMYSTTHFHSTTHEVLCIANGRASLCFGGENNPGRVESVLSKGDVAIIPAGLAHRLLDDLDGDFLMVGSYPKGKHWDMCYGKEDETEEIVRISSLGWFDRDPIYGSEGPTLDEDGSRA